MPTPFVGLHAAPAILIALFGLSFIADPCGGGGDLCLGGAVGVGALSVAGIGGLGLVVWRFRQRASLLLVWDCALVALAGYLVIETGSYEVTLTLLGAQLIVLLGVPAAALAARAVVRHRIESIIVVATLVAIALFGGAGGIAVLALGLLALGAGWILAHRSPASAA